jgi:hypothetical protein
LDTHGDGNAHRICGNHVRPKFIPAAIQPKPRARRGPLDESAIDGPVHNYVPSAPGCWKTFGEVQADEPQRFGYPPAHGTEIALRAIDR